MYDVVQLWNRIDSELIPEDWKRILEYRNLKDNFISNLIRTVPNEMKKVKGMWWWKKTYYQPIVIKWLISKGSFNKLSLAFPFDSTPEGKDMWEIVEFTIQQTRSTKDWLEKHPLKKPY